MQVARALREIATPRNHEGFECFHHGLQDQVRNFLCTGTFTGTFYVSADKIGHEMIETLSKLAKQDAGLLADEVIFAREHGYMRTMPIVALAVLSGEPDKEPLFRAAEHVLRTPHDVAQFIQICESGAVPGVCKFGGCRVKAARKFCENLSEFHAIKGTNVKQMTLEYIVHLTHPLPDSDKRRELLGWLSGHVRGSSVHLNRQVAAYEALKRATGRAEQVRLIHEGSLPYEAVVAAVSNPSKEVWEALLAQAPIFNLLKNLATFTRHGVFEKRENVELAVRKLTRPDGLSRSRVLPFQCYTAWKAYSSGAFVNSSGTFGVNPDPMIVAALSDALEMSICSKMPVIQGRTAIAVDVSGSMHTCFTNDECTTSAAEVAGIFAAGLLKQCPNARLLPFDTSVISVAINPRDSVLANARTISSLGGGGTSMSAPVNRLFQEKDMVDFFVGITDNEEWIGQPFVEAWRWYTINVNPKAKAVLVTVVPSTMRAVPESEPGVRYVHGWSDAVMKFVAEACGVQSAESPDAEETN